MTHLKNVIRDGGGTALLTAYTAHFPYNADSTEMKLLIQCICVYIYYTANTSIWLYGLWSKKRDWTEVEWMDTPSLF